MNVDQLLRLYPRRWRARYEDEMRALLNDTGVTPVVVFDLLRGAGREWIRTLVRPQTAPIDVKYEGRRNFAIALGSGVIVWTLSVLLADQCRPFVRSWDSSWEMVLGLPYLAPLFRAAQVSLRRSKIRKRAALAASPVREDEVIAAGVSHGEYWMLIVVFTLGRTALRVKEAHNVFEQCMDFYMVCFWMHRLRLATRTSYARKLQVDELARQARLTRLNL